MDLSLQPNQLLRSGSVVSWFWQNSTVRVKRKKCGYSLGKGRLIIRHAVESEMGQTKDPLYVKEFLGHKKLDTTLLYIQIERAIIQRTIRRVHC